MPYRIQDWNDVTAEVHRIGLEQIDRGVAAIDDGSLERSVQVHEARKRCKKLRGLARLVRKSIDGGAYDRCNAHFRDAARRVAGGRDRAAFIETYDRLCDGHDEQIDRRAFASIRAGLTRRLGAWQAQQDQGAGDAALDRLRTDLEAGRALVEALRPEADGFAAVAGGLNKTYRRARHRLDDAADKPKAKRLHTWRKRVKYHRYHLNLLRGLWRPPIEALGEEASRLGDLLGDAHDLSELRRHLDKHPDGLGNPDDVRAFLDLAAGRQEQLERRALIEGRRQLHLKPKRLKQTLRSCHRVVLDLDTC
jgi:CHAD domain-containing protein